jgi:hypothetical protein
MVQSHACSWNYTCSILSENKVGSKGKKDVGGSKVITDKEQITR